MCVLIAPPPPALSTAYRKACLEHHPDKKLVGVECEKAKEDAEEHFKKVGTEENKIDQGMNVTLYHCYWFACLMCACLRPAAGW